MDSFVPIHDNLIDQPLDPSVLTDGHPGYPPEVAQGDTLDVLIDCCGSASRDFPKAMWLEPDQRLDKARENDKNKTWGINFVDRFTNQGSGNGGYSTHECTCHMLRAEAEGCRNRQRGIIFPDGPIKGARYEESTRGSVWLSPLSIYAEANPRERGGAGCWQVLEIALKRGFLPEKIQPREYNFRHTLHGTCGAGGMNQSRGPWVPLSQFPAGHEETSKLFKPEEIIFTTDPEQALCMLCWGLILGYGRNGHAIPPCLWNSASNAFGYVDSYDEVRFDSWNTFRSAVRSGVHAIASMSTSDDWMNPAGDAHASDDRVTMAV